MSEFKVNHWLQLGYLSATVSGMAFGLLSITIASLCGMLGPGLALRGGEGAASMHKAVDNMAIEAKQCFMFFLGQLLFFHVSSLLLMWVLYSKTVAIITNVILCAFIYLFIRNGMEIYQKLVISEDEAVSGKFVNFSGYESMGALDKQQSQVQGRNYTTPHQDTMSQGSGIGQSRQGVAGGKPSSFIGNTNTNMDKYQNNNIIRRAGTPEIRQNRGAEPRQQIYMVPQQPVNNEPGQIDHAYDRGNSYVVSAFQNAFNPKEDTPDFKGNDPQD